MPDLNITDIFEELLQGKRNRFPPGTWNHSSNAVILVKYLIENKLKWSDEDVRNNLNTDVFTLYKLSGMLQLVFGNSAYDALSATYPNKFKPSEMKFGPRGRDT